MREFQKVFIVTVLRDQKGNQVRAAQELGMNRNTLRRTRKELEVDIKAVRVMSARASGIGEKKAGRGKHSYG